MEDTTTTETTATIAASIAAPTAPAAPAGPSSCPVDASVDVTQDTTTTETTATIAAPAAPAAPAASAAPAAPSAPAGPSSCPVDASVDVTQAPDLRIVLLGKTGAGKSSLAETVLVKKVFEIDHTANSGTDKCQSATKEVHGRNITVIDTPGFFDSRMSEDDLKSEIATCITECSPGIHAFLILLKVERYTEQENEVISKIRETFSEKAFRYSVVVFTHGDQLAEGMQIEEFVRQNEGLRDLLEKCGGRCHVLDNKYWNNNHQDEYRNNQQQVQKLLNTITEMVDQNHGDLYTNEMLQAVERKIQEEEERIRSSFPHMSQEDIKIEAKKRISNFLKTAASISTGTLLGTLVGAPAMVCAIVILFGAGVAAAAGPLGVAAAVAATAGAAVGSYTGYREANKAKSTGEAARKTAKAVWLTAKRAPKAVRNFHSWVEKKVLQKK